MIRPGDRVRVHQYRETQKKRELICTSRGKVLVVHKDKVAVLIDGDHKHQTFPMINVEPCHD